MTFEAIGVGRVLSAIQRKMLLDLSNWPDNEATDYNRQELIWKELIYRTSWSRNIRLPTVAWVAMALRMRALADRDLAALLSGDGWPKPRRRRRAA